MTKNAFLARDTIYYEKLGLQRNVELWEDGLRTNGGNNSYEWWYFDAEYSNGYKVVIIFYTKNIFDVKGHAMPVGTIDITFPNGNSITKLISEDNTKIRASKDKCDLQICDSVIKYDNENYIIDFICPELKYHCTLKPTFPMWRPETGHIYFGDKAKDYFAWLVAVPSGTCNATLTIEGTVINMTGTGYHDHNWGNCSLTDVIDNWYWCHTTINNYTVIVFDIISKKNYSSTRIPLILIGKDNVIFDDCCYDLIFNRLSPIIHPLTSKLVHNHLSLTKVLDNNTTTLTIDFLRDHDILVSNLINTFGYSKTKMIALCILKRFPTYLRSIGMVTLTINKNNKEYTYEKEGIWEQMYFSSR